MITKRKPHIAFTGIRGIPASYSGFETFVENFARILVKFGFKVTVYNRSSYNKKRKDSFYGVQIVSLPTIKNKFLDTFIHTFLALLHSFTKKYDLIYICGVGNSLLSFMPRLLGKKVILNVDGLDWRREKWEPFAKKFLKFSERISICFPNITLTDSKTVKTYYKKNYQKNIHCIPYFVQIRKSSSRETLKQYHLTKDKYILFVGRLVPENNVHQLISAYQRIETDCKLVIIGDAPYSKQYINNIKQYQNDRIIFTGYLFKKAYQELSSHAYFFVLPGRAGGTRVVLLEQMALGNCILVNNSPNNLEVLEEYGLSYDGLKKEETLVDSLNYLLNHPEVIEQYRKKVRERIRKQYALRKVLEAYERLFTQLGIYK
ncbi:glycosyltransferase [Candidatus Auribacterota bacterium]